MVILIESDGQLPFVARFEDFDRQSRSFLGVLSFSVIHSNAKCSTEQSNKICGPPRKQCELENLKFSYKHLFQQFILIRIPLKYVYRIFGIRKDLAKIFRRDLIVFSGKHQA